MKNATFGVIVQEQGKKASVALVGSGATVRSALKAVRISEDKVEGRITLNNKKAGLGDRLKTNDLLVISEPVTGGAR